MSQQGECNSPNSLNPRRVRGCQGGSCTTLRLRWLVQVLPGTRLPGSSVSGNEVPGLLVWGACQDGGDLGEKRGAPALVNPFPSSAGFRSCPRDGPQPPRSAPPASATGAAASASPCACLPRDEASPGIWWKKEGREEVSSQCKAAGAKSEPRKSPAHPSWVKRALCVLRSTQAAPAHGLLCAAAQLMACSFHKCRWSAVPRPRASLLIT